VHDFAYEFQLDDVTCEYTTGKLVTESSSGADHMTWLQTRIALLVSAMTAIGILSLSYLASTGGHQGAHARDAVRAPLRWSPPLSDMFASDDEYRAWIASGDYKRTVFERLWSTVVDVYKGVFQLPLLYMTETHTCLDLSRVGGNRTAEEKDGAKWICGAKRLPRSCISYSIGSNRDVSYERELHAATGCESWTFDPTVPADWQPPAGSHIAAFTRVGLAAARGEIMTGGAFPMVVPVDSLEGLMSIHGHDHIDVLKVDIEEAEWGWFLGFFRAVFDGDKDGKRVWTCKTLPLLMMVEMHFMVTAADKTISAGRPNGLDEYSSVLRSLRKMGYLQYMSEPNNICPLCVEIAFMLDEHECWRHLGSA
jgi:hypothetical protein